MADTRIFQGAGGVKFTMDVPAEGTMQRDLFDEKVAKGELVEYDADGQVVGGTVDAPELLLTRQERRGEPVEGTEGLDRDERRAEPVNPSGPEAGEAVLSLPMDKVPGSVTAKGVIGEDGEVLPPSDPMVDSQVSEAVIDGTADAALQAGHVPPAVRDEDEDDLPDEATATPVKKAAKKAKPSPKEF